MDNDTWMEKCFNRYVDMGELQWLILFAVSYTRKTRNAILRRTRFNDAAHADSVLQSCNPVLEEILNFQMQHKEEDPSTGVITAEAVEEALKQRLTPAAWGAIAECGGLEKHTKAFSQHLLRKTVVAAVGRSYETTEGYVLDGHNKLFNINPVMWTGPAATYAGRLPGPIIATHTEASDLKNHVPNIYELIEKVMKTRFSRPVSQFSMVGKTSYAGTGLLTKEEIVKHTEIDEATRERM